MVLKRKDILDEFKAKQKKKKNLRSIDRLSLKWELPDKTANKAT